jgi:hypothetical protein
MKEIYQFCKILQFLQTAVGAGFSIIFSLAVYSIFKNFTTND